MLRAVRLLEKAAAKHRSERKGNESRDQNGHRDGDGEFVEQPPKNSAHEQHGNEHRRQRQRHRENGEAYLASAFEGRLKRRFALLDVTDNIFEDDDGVIDHKADGEDERHEREIVDAEVQADTSRRTCR